MRNKDRSWAAVKGQNQGTIPWTHQSCEGRGTKFLAPKIAGRTPTVSLCSTRLQGSCGQTAWKINFSIYIFCQDCVMHATFELRCINDILPVTFMIWGKMLFQKWHFSALRWVLISGGLVFSVMYSLFSGVSGGHLNLSVLGFLGEKHRKTTKTELNNLEDIVQLQSVFMQTLSEQSWPSVSSSSCSGLLPPL